MGAIIRAPRIRPLAGSAVAVSGPADTSENILATITVPAGAMGLNGRLRITTQWTVTSSANNKILRVRFSGAAGTAYLNTTQTTIVGLRSQFEVCNQNSVSAQSGFSGAAGSGGFGTTSAATVTSSVDTTAATTLVITGQKASAGETITLESYLVELILP